MLSNMSLILRDVPGKLMQISLLSTPGSLKVAHPMDSFSSSLNSLSNPVSEPVYIQQPDDELTINIKVKGCVCTICNATQYNVPECHHFVYNNTVVANRRISVHGDC